MTNGSLILVTPIHIPNGVWKFCLRRFQHVYASPGAAEAGNTSKIPALGKPTVLTDIALKELLQFL